MGRAGPRPCRRPATGGPCSASAGGCRAADRPLPPSLVYPAPAALRPTRARRDAHGLLSRPPRPVSRRVSFIEYTGRHTGPQSSVACTYRGLTPPPRPPGHSRPPGPRGRGGEGPRARVGVEERHAVGRAVALLREQARVVAVGPCFGAVEAQRGAHQGRPPARPRPNPAQPCSAAGARRGAGRPRVVTTTHQSCRQSLWGRAGC